MRVAGAGGHETHALVVTGDEADLVSAGRTQPCDGLARRQGNLFLRLARGGERTHFTASINNEHDLQVRRGLVPFDDGRTRPGCRRPVDFTHIIARLVGSQVHELPSASMPKRGVVPIHDGQQLAQDGQLDAGGQRVDFSRAYRHCVPLESRLAWDRVLYGTGTALKTASMSPSMETLSATASKVRMMR